MKPIPCSLIVPIGTLVVFLTACAPPERVDSTRTSADRPAVADGAVRVTEVVTPARTTVSQNQSRAVASTLDSVPTAEAAPPVSRVAQTPASVVKQRSAENVNATDVTAAESVSTQPLPLAVVAAAYPQSFTAEQKQVLLQLGESFLAATAAPPVVSPTEALNEKTLTPAERWLVQTMESDERFKAMFGYEAFNAMQLQRAREAYEEGQVK